MTALMEQAFQETASLPEPEQNWLAQILMNLIRDEQEWDRQFADSQDMLNALGEKTLAEYEAGQTTEISA